MFAAIFVSLTTTFPSVVARLFVNPEMLLVLVRILAVFVVTWLSKVEMLAVFVAPTSATSFTDLEVAASVSEVLEVELLS